MTGWPVPIRAKHVHGVVARDRGPETRWLRRRACRRVPTLTDENRRSVRERSPIVCGPLFGVGVPRPCRTSVPTEHVALSGDRLMSDPRSSQSLKRLEVLLMTLGRPKICALGV